MCLRSLFAECVYSQCIYMLLIDWYWYSAVCACVRVRACVCVCVSHCPSPSCHPWRTVVWHLDTGRYLCRIGTWSHHQGWCQGFEAQVAPSPSAYVPLRTSSRLISCQLHLQPCPLSHSCLYVSIWEAAFRRGTLGLRTIVGLANVFLSACAPGITVTFEIWSFRKCNRQCRPGLGD